MHKKPVGNVVVGTGVVGGCVVGGRAIEMKISFAW